MILKYLIIINCLISDFTWSVTESEIRNPRTMPNNGDYS